MYGKSNMETYITMCKVDNQQGFAVWIKKVKQELWKKNYYRILNLKLYFPMYLKNIFSLLT